MSNIFVGPTHRCRTREAACVSVRIPTRRLTRYYFFCGLDLLLALPVRSTGPPASVAGASERAI